MAPKYMVSDALPMDIEYFIDWVQKNTDNLEAYVKDDMNQFVLEMENLYIALCSIHAHWLEMEAARILRLTELGEGELCLKLVTPFITNLRTLAIDIQMAQNTELANLNSQRSIIEPFRDVISSMNIISELLQNSDFEKALDIMMGISEFQDDDNAVPLIASITLRNQERAMALTDKVIAEYNKKIESIINVTATESVVLKKLLIVDDMPEILTALSLMLKGHYQVFAFTEGEQALDFIDKKQRPDAFLLDIDMPKIDGLTLARKIRARVKYESAPIIFLTSDSSRDTFMRALSYDPKAFIVKPAIKDILVSKLNSCLK